MLHQYAIMYGLMIVCGFYLLTFEEMVHVADKLSGVLSTKMLWKCSSNSNKNVQFYHQSVIHLFPTNFCPYIQPFFFPNLNFLFGVNSSAQLVHYLDMFHTIYLFCCWPFQPSGSCWCKLVSPSLSVVRLNANMLEYTHLQRPDALQQWKYFEVNVSWQWDAKS